MSWQSRYATSWKSIDVRKHVLHKFPLSTTRPSSSCQARHLKESHPTTYHNIPLRPMISHHVPRYPNSAKSGHVVGMPRIPLSWVQHEVSQFAPHPHSYRALRPHDVLLIILTTPSSLPPRCAQYVSMTWSICRRDVVNLSSSRAQYVPTSPCAQQFPMTSSDVLNKTSTTTKL